MACVIDILHATPWVNAASFTTVIHSWDVLGIINNCIMSTDYYPVLCSLLYVAVIRRSVLCRGKIFK
jgi:hypothetical protein